MISIEISDAWHGYVRAVFFLFLIFVFIYFFDLVSFPLSIDEELTATRRDPAIWISQGRWGAYLVELFFPQPTIPFLPLAFFGLCASVTYCTLVDLLGREGRLTIIDYLSFSIFAGYPVWFFITEFYSNLAPVGLGLISSALATHCFLQERKIAPSIGQAVVGIALGAFAIGTYQSYTAVLVVMICGVLVLQMQAGMVQRPWSKALIGACLWMVSVGVYSVLDKLFKFLPHPPSSYFESLWRPDAVMSDPLRVLTKLGNLVLDVFGISGQFGYPLWAAPLVLLLGLSSVLLWAKDRSRSIFAFTIVVAGVMITAPLALGLFGGGDLPIRALIGVPVTMWVFACLALQDSRQIVHTAAVISTCILLWQSVVIANRYQAIEYFSNRRDEQIAASIGQMVLSLPDYDPAKSYYLVMFGAYRFPTGGTLPDSTTVGGSFFGWDGGNPGRVSAYMSLFGYPGLKYPPQDVEARYLPEIGTMPVFPSPGSVVLADDSILLRMSREPSSQDLAVPGWRH